tara:strand:- start:258 stop:611 length:354 start_codon:yes stop_codon:yes gene_type:complete
MVTETNHITRLWTQDINCRNARGVHAVKVPSVKICEKVIENLEQSLALAKQRHKLLTQHKLAPMYAPKLQLWPTDNPGVYQLKVYLKEVPADTLTSVTVLEEPHTPEVDVSNYLDIE